MIIPKNNDRSWGKPQWKWMQRYERCANRVMGSKMEKSFLDSFLFGKGYYEITKNDLNSVIDFMNGKKS